MQYKGINFRMQFKQPLIQATDAKECNDLHHCDLKFFRPIHKESKSRMQQLILRRAVARKAYTPNNCGRNIRIASPTIIPTIKGCIGSLQCSTISPVIMARRRSTPMRLEEITRNLFQQNRFKKLLLVKQNTVKIKRSLLCQGKSCNEMGFGVAFHRARQMSTRISIDSRDNIASLPEYAGEPCSSSRAPNSKRSGKVLVSIGIETDRK